MKCGGSDIFFNIDLKFISVFGGLFFLCFFLNMQKIMLLCMEQEVVMIKVESRTPSTFCVNSSFGDVP